MGVIAEPLNTSQVTVNTSAVGPGYPGWRHSPRHRIFTADTPVRHVLDL